MKSKLLPFFVVCLLTFGVLAADEATSPALDLRVYHIGNSLTRNLPLERLQLLFASAGGSYEYGIQLGGGHRLEQHLSKRNHGNKPGEGTYNTIQRFGEYDEAFTQFTFDAVVLQPFAKQLDAAVQILDRWPWFSCGDLQAASAFIDYARGRTQPGKGAWHLENANDEHTACERFYIYATWPGARDVLDWEDGDPTFADWYAQPYEGGVVSCSDFYRQLVERLNDAHPDLPVPVRLIPAGEVMAALDERIRDGSLAGIEAFFDRNQEYFVRARRNNNKPSPFDPDSFEAKAGVLNVYADGVHLNDQPHNGEDSGTIGSYVAAMTVFSTLSGKSPVGLTVEPYEQFDPEADAALIEALQETVWEVVSNHAHTGVGEVGEGGGSDEEAGDQEANRSPVAPGAELRKLADGFRFTEGPACDHEGNVYFTDQPNDRIHKWSIDGELSVFLEPAGRSNGLYIDANNTLWACADEKNELWKIDLATKEHEVVVRDFDGKRLNGPNDVWVAPNGDAYFTDPFFKRPYWDRGPMEQDGRYAYLLPSDGSGLRRVTPKMGLNGIVGTPDGKTLYLYSGGIVAYDIEPDGSLANERKLIEIKGGDGLTLDEAGNIYTVGKGVSIVSPEGDLLDRIDVPERWTANVCFGGKDHRTSSSRRAPGSMPSR